MSDRPAPKTDLVSVATTFMETNEDRFFSTNSGRLLRALDALIAGGYVRRATGGLWEITNDGRTMFVAARDQLAAQLDKLTSVA